MATHQEIIEAALARLNWEHDYYQSLIAAMAVKLCLPLKEESQ